MISIVEERKGMQKDQFQKIKKVKGLKMTKFKELGKKLIISQDKRQQQKLSHISNQAIQNQIWQSEINKLYQKGVPKKYLQKLRKMKMGKSNRKCSICCNDFLKDETIIQLPCKHIFHQSCLFSWLDHSTKCPNCRSDVIEGLKNQEK